MYSRIFATLLTYVSIGWLSISSLWTNDMPELMEVEAIPIERTIETDKTPVEVYNTVVPEIKARMVETPSVEEVVEVEQEPEIVEEVLPLSDDEIDLLALVTMAEAEGESEEGKRLVIDTILNRVDSELKYFPDTVTDVIYQKNAFTSMWNGRVDRCHVDENIRQLVIEELKSRTNYDVMYFCAGKYSKYGTPIFQVGNHYFSSN